MKAVSIERCDHYEDKNVHEAIQKLVNHLGGWKRFIKPGDRVAVKPNLLMYKKPEDAATTHPTVVKAVISQVQEAGGIVTIAESPGGPYSQAMLRYVYKMTGIEKVADETGAILNYDLRVEAVSHQHAKFIKHLEVIKPLADADVIINLPKLKTHTMMTYTGAVKNMFGSVAGTTKADFHLRMPDYNKFADSLIDIYLSIKPALHIMDAVVGMEGYGPTTGERRQIGVLMASDDGFALDTAAVRIIHLPCEKVPVLNQAKIRNLIDSDVNILGEPIEKVMIKDYNIPALNLTERPGRFDKGVLKFMKSHLRPRPVIQDKHCVRCGNCVRNCPPKVIVMEKGKIPVIDYRGCIRCFCCHELCAHNAITIHRNLLSRAMMSRGFSGYNKKNT